MSESTYIFDVSAENFQQLVLDQSSKQLVLADFWASWCGPCQTLIPLLEKLASEYAGKFLLAKINSDEQQALAAHFQVRSLPTVKFFKDGAMVDEFMGAQPESAIRELLDRHIDMESDRVWHQARQLIASDNEDEGLILLLEAHQADPTNSKIVIELATLTIQRKRFDEAKSLLDNLNAEDQALTEVISLNAKIAFVSAASESPSIGELQDSLAENPDNLQSLLWLSIHRVVQDDYQSAMELLLRLLKKDAKFQDGVARKKLVDIFDLLNNEGDLVNQYRRKLATLLN